MAEEQVNVEVVFYVDGKNRTPHQRTPRMSLGDLKGELDHDEVQKLLLAVKSAYGKIIRERNL
jgi:hypothetical protein